MTTGGRLAGRITGLVGSLCLNVIYPKVGGGQKRGDTHERDGRLEPGTQMQTEVSGGQTAREIAEHKRIQEKTGGVPAKNSNAVSNKKDPIGPNRRGLLK